MAEETKMASENSTVSEDKKERIIKQRSPNYPAIGLEKALERAQTLQGHARHHFTPVFAAHDLWKYKRGAGDQMVAALKQFGLLEVQGEKERREVRLTDMARRILGNAPDRDNLLKIAALKPDLHKEIWDKYEGALPADSIIKNYLVWERNFNTNFVDGFIAQFRGTVAFAKIDLSDNVRSEDDQDKEEDDMSLFDTRNTGTQRSKQMPPPPANHREFPLYLTKNQKGTLYVPAEMSPKDYDLLKKQIENHLAIILVTSVADAGGEKEDREQ